MGDTGRVRADARDLYGGCYRRLVLAAFAVVDDLGEAEVCVQQAFGRVRWTSRRISADGGPESGLRARALALARARRRRRTMLDRVLRRPPPRPADPPDLEPESAALLVALRRLPADEREALALQNLADLPVAETAHVIGSSPRRAARRLSRARSAFADQPPDRRPTADDFAALRVGIEDTIRQPPFDEVLLQAGRDRRRRRAVAGIASVAVVGAAALGVEVDRSARLPTGTPVTQLQFADNSHGFALLQSCPHGDRLCLLRLARTDDGGRHWNRVEIPESFGADPGAAILTVGDRDRLSIDFGRKTRTGSGALADGLAMRVSETVRLRGVTHDGGRTWQTVPAPRVFRTGPPIATLPTGWGLTVFSTGGKWRFQVAASDPVDNATRPLRHQPRLDDPNAEAPLRPGGRIWVDGYDPTRRFVPRLVESDDAGVSWAPVTLPSLRPTEEVAGLFPTVAGGVYLQTKLPGDGTVRRTWRLEDAARGRWTLLPPLDPGPGAVVQAVLPDGELWLAGYGPTTWRTEDRGSRVVRVREPLVNGRRTAVVLDGVTHDGVLYGTGPAGGRDDVVFTSRDDGRHWTARPVLF